MCLWGKFYSFKKKKEKRFAPNYSHRQSLNNMWRDRKWLPLCCVEYIEYRRSDNLHASQRYKHTLIHYFWRCVHFLPFTLTLICNSFQTSRNCVSFSRISPSFFIGTFDARMRRSPFLISVCKMELNIRPWPEQQYCTMQYKCITSLHIREYLLSSCFRQSTTCTVDSDTLDLTSLWICISPLFVGMCSYNLSFSNKKLFTSSSTHIHPSVISFSIKVTQDHVTAPL